MYYKSVLTDASSVHSLNYSLKKAFFISQKGLQ